MKTKFITFEGIDGCGKTTVSKHIANYFKNESRLYDIRWTSEPSRSLIGKKITDLIKMKNYTNLPKRTELLLFLADRFLHLEEEIKPSIKRGCSIICDRYNDSTIAYQIYGQEQEKYKDEIMTIINACDFLVPNVTIWIDIPVELAIERLKNNPKSSDRLLDHTEEDKLFHFFSAVRKGYNEIYEANRHRIIKVNGLGSINNLIWDCRNIILNKEKERI